MARFPKEFVSRDGVFVPAGTAAFLAYTDGVEAEGYLVEVLDRATDLGSGSRELAAAIRDWPSRYHLSSERANLLRALDLDAAARVLEIGAGCGAITRYLGETCARVVAVEGSLARATIAHRRCRGLAGVEVVACDFQDFVTSEAFDIVTLIGVLEYAAQFARGAKDPFAALIARAAARLRPGGALIVAIENRLGVKYLAGCGEDHGAPRFANLEGYPDPDGPRTFGRAELAALLEAQGLTSTALLLPFPDYKVPTTFVNAARCGADDARRLGLAQWCSMPFADYVRPRQFLFSDHLALAGLAANGLLADHANSFLWVARKGHGGSLPVGAPAWAARRYNVSRHPAFRTTTTLVEDGGAAWIRKERMPGAGPADPALPLTQRLEERSALHESARALSSRMLAALRRGSGGADAFAAELRTWLAFLLKHGATGNGESSLRPEFLDCIPDNLLEDGRGRWHYVDREWAWSEPVPLGWVLFRGLLSLWRTHAPWIAGDAFERGASFADFHRQCLALLGATEPHGAAAEWSRREALLQRIVADGCLPASGGAGAIEIGEMLGSDLDFGREAREDLDRRAARLARTVAEADMLGAALESAQRAARDQAVADAAGRQAEEIAGAVTAELVAAALTASDEPEPEQHLYEIVVPVYDGVDDLLRCLDALLAHTDSRHGILLVDDASPDDRVAGVLDAYAARDPRIRVHRLPENRGFPGAVNAGLERTTRDVVLLNADTVVTPGWLARMDRCRRSDPRIHTVTPLSNNATICSVPQFNQKNPLPDGLSPDDMARLVARTSLHRYPRVPTGVGFCLLVTRALIDAVGPLDEAFGRGYGEEVDWCQRGWAYGMESAICDDAFVYHHGEVGFSAVPERRTLQERNRELVAQRWPAYERAVRTWCLLNPLRLQHQRLFAALRRPPGDRRLRLLHVVHSYGVPAGTELHTRRVVAGTRERFDNTVLHPAPLDGWFDAVAHEDEDGTLQVTLNAATVPARAAIFGAPLESRSLLVERAFAEIVAGSGAELVHFHHLARFGTLALPAVARRFGAKVVVSAHDLFFLCPDFTMLGLDGRHCGRSQYEGDARCVACLGAKAARVEGLGDDALAALLAERQAVARAALLAADAIVAPSAAVADRLALAFGEEIAARTAVIGHGTEELRAASRHGGDRTLHAIFLGNLTAVKGRAPFLEAVRRLAGRPIRFSVVGAAPGGKDLAALARRVALTGSYTPGELPKRLADADVVVIPSVGPESYCFTLDEALRLGIPVVASRIGALAERVVHETTGLLVEPGDAAGLAAALERLASDRALLDRLRAGVRGLSFKSVAENVAEYEALYDGLLARRFDRNTLLRHQALAAVAAGRGVPQPQGT